MIQEVATQDYGNGWVIHRFVHVEGSSEGSARMCLSLESVTRTSES